MSAPDSRLRRAVAVASAAAGQRAAGVAASARTPRADGAETRQQLLEIAGRVFAEKGYARTTSREICAAAGTNVAAVNYHFGGKDGLYEAVLIEAHGQFLRLDELDHIARSGATPETQVRALVALLVARTSADVLPWGLRVLIHEMLAPTGAATPWPALMRDAVLPKMRAMRVLLARLLGVPAEHPLVQRAQVCVVTPCLMMIIAPRAVLRQGLPALLVDHDALVEDLTRNALGGLAALAHAPRRASDAASPAKANVTTKLRRSAVSAPSGRRARTADR